MCVRIHTNASIEQLTEIHALIRMDSCTDVVLLWCHTLKVLILG